MALLAEVLSVGIHALKVLKRVVGSFAWIQTQKLAVMRYQRLLHNRLT